MLKISKLMKMQFQNGLLTRNFLTDPNTLIHMYVRTYRCYNIDSVIFVLFNRRVGFLKYLQAVFIMQESSKWISFHRIILLVIRSLVFVFFVKVSAFRLRSEINFTVSPLWWWSVSFGTFLRLRVLFWTDS
jgi:hypothetical protein